MNVELISFHAVDLEGVREFEETVTVTKCDRENDDSYNLLSTSF